MLTRDKNGKNIGQKWVSATNGNTCICQRENVKLFSYVTVHVRVLCTVYVCMRVCAVTAVSWAGVC